MLRVARVIDFTNQANVPLTVDTKVSKVVTFKTQLVVARMVARMVAGERGVNWYAVNGSSGVNFVAELSALEGQFDFGGEGGGGSGWERLGVGRHSQFFDISF